MNSQDWKAKQSDIENYYSALINQYGHDPRACDYGRASSQLAKFEVISAGIRETSALNLLDVGCGFADYADYLQANGQSNISYYGLDLSQQMIDNARELHPALTFYRGDICELEFDVTFDYVTANGIFYLLGEAAEDYMQTLVARMFALSKKGLIFNSLSSLADTLEPGEFYADPSRVLAFCQTLTRNVILRHDYLGHDFTVYMYR